MLESIHRWVERYFESKELESRALREVEVRLRQVVEELAKANAINSAKLQCSYGYGAMNPTRSTLEYNEHARRVLRKVGIDLPPGKPVTE